MTATAFPHCCGIRIAAAFGGTTNHHEGNVNYPDEQIIKFLENEVKISKSNGKATIIATINEHQREKMRPIFKQLGWRCVNKAWHPNHSIHIYTWMINLQESPS